MNFNFIGFQIYDSKYRNLYFNNYFKNSENNNEESDIIVIPTNHTIEDLIKL